MELVLQTIKVYVYSEEFDKDSELSLDFRDQLGRTPLYNACYYGFHDIAQLIVGFFKEHGSRVSVSVNTAVKGSNRTPIHAAIRKGNMDTIRLLLSVTGADLSLEARPSGRTQRRLLAIYQKVHQGQSYPKMGRLEEKDIGKPDGGGGGFSKRKISESVEIEVGGDRESQVTPDLLSPRALVLPL